MLDYCEPVGASEWHEHVPSLIEAEQADRRKRILEERVFAEALVASKVATRPIDHQRSLAERFQEQADKWERETAHVSSPAQRMTHPSYQAILGMGRDHNREIIELLIHDMRKNERPWFNALSYLTQENPINRADAGDMDKMITAWVNWGKIKGLL